MATTTHTDGDVASGNGWAGTLRRLPNGRASRSYAKALAADSQTDRWNAWVAHLSERTTPVWPTELAPSRRGGPLAWAVPEGPDRQRSDSLIRRLSALERSVQPAKGHEVAGKLTAWLAETDRRRPDATFGLECLAWCRALPHLAPTVSAAAWWELIERLGQTAADAAVIDPLDRPLAHQLLTGELPLTLAFLLPEIDSCHRLASSGRKALSRGLADLLDGQGMLHCRHLPLLRPLLACWTRGRLIDRLLGREGLTAQARNQHDWLVRQALRLTRQNGTQVFSGDADGPWCPDLIEAALTLSDDPEDWAIAERVIGSRRIRQAADPDEEPAPPTEHSEWSELAVMRTDWSPASPQFALAYADRSCTVELSTARQLVCSGRWDPEIRVERRSLRAESDWEEICWTSDDDIDYIELEISFCDGWRLQRQVLLAREDGFLFAADALLGDRRAAIDYRCRLPLVAGVSCKAADQTREVFLLGRKTLGRILPLALPEWRIDARFGSLTTSAHGVELVQSATASALYAPLFVDLDPRRMRRQLTWRQLTVAERLENQPADVALGYRVQIGKRQWLFYRSLTPPANRTVLGQNLFCDFMAAQFDCDGEIESLIEVE